MLFARCEQDRLRALQPFSNYAGRFLSGKRRRKCALVGTDENTKFTVTKQSLLYLFSDIFGQRVPNSQF